MTIIERVKSVVHSDVDLCSTGTASIEKMIAMAYWMGREEAARQVSDMYSKHIAEQRERAEKCRYRHMAEAVVGNERFLYCSDYAGDMTGTFGSDPADI